eukprot:677562-Rhodomonas_salina.1
MGRNSYPPGTWCRVIKQSGNEIYTCTGPNCTPTPGTRYPGSVMPLLPGVRWNQGSATSDAYSGSHPGYGCGA